MGRAWTDEQKAKSSATKKKLVANGWKPWHAGKHLSDEDKQNRSRSMRAKYASGWRPIRHKPRKYDVGDAAVFKSHGYRMLYLPDHPCAHSNGFIAEHRVIAERALGRLLKRDETVHHINGVKDDNRNSNLLICSVKYHAELHERMSAMYQKMIFCKEKPL